MKTLKPAHVVFINGMVTHRDRIRAYQEAYPRSSASAAKANACRLLKNPAIKQHIDLYDEMVDAKRDRERVEQIKNRFTDFMDSQEPLWNIVAGHPIQKKTAGGLLVMRYPSISERLSAMFTAEGNEKRFLEEYPQYARWLADGTNSEQTNMLPLVGYDAVHENKKDEIRDILFPRQQPIRRGGELVNTYEKTLYSEQRLSFYRQIVPAKSLYRKELQPICCRDRCFF